MRSRSPADIERKHKIQRCLELRRTGLTLAQVAEELNIARSTVQVYLATAFMELQQDSLDVAHELRALEADRLDALQREAWAMMSDEYTSGIVKLKAMDRLLKISERRAKLFGLDAPQKVALTNPAGDAPFQAAVKEMSEDELRAIIERGGTDAPSMLDTPAMLDAPAILDIPAMHDEPASAGACDAGACGVGASCGQGACCGASCGANGAGHPPAA